MKISILGAVNVGGTFARARGRKGHGVFFGVPRPSHVKMQQVLKTTGSKAHAGTVAASAGAADVIALSDPRDASGYSSTDLISMGFIASVGFIATPKLAALVNNTKKASEIEVARFDAIVVAGGQSPMFTFELATDLQKNFVDFHEAGKIACALCHGVAILKYAKLTNGKYLAKGKTLTGFANVE
jgi:putative intracellular protease/amidase